MSSNKITRICALLASAAALALAGESRASTYYVDPNYAGTNGAAFNGYTAAYNNIAAALAAVPAGASVANPNYVYFAAGTYNVGATSLSYSRSNVDLVGLTGNANDVVITSTLDSAYNPGSGAIGTTGSATLQLKGNNITAANITFANSTDTPYIDNVTHSSVSPTGSYTGNTAQTSSQPAVALLLQGDEQAFQNCKFLGFQDTLYTKGGRSYFTNCTVSGDDDFIFANGTTVFNNCTINIDGDHSGGCVTAASTDKRTSNGLVFLNSTITGNSVHGNSVIDPNNAANTNGPNAGSMYLGRPWGWTQTGGDASAVYINDKMTNAISPAGWLNWDSTELSSPTKNNGNLAEDSRFAEYGSTDLSGNLLSTALRVTWSHQLTASQATAYTVPNLFASEYNAGTNPAGYAWYGQGYPASDTATPGTGSANPTDLNYSWPAFWGDRNAQNETANDTVAGTVGTPPIPGNPTGYTDPSWTLGGNWDPTVQLSFVPEPVGAGLFCGMFLMIGRRRRS